MYGEEPSSRPDADSQPVDDVLTVGSGLTAAEIQMLDGSQSAPTVPEAIHAALEGDVVVDGATYQGCGDYVDQMTENLPAEDARARLNDLYIDFVTVKVFADDRWARADASWAECMAGNGYRDLQRPGDHFVEVQQRITEAAGNLEALRTEVLPFDIAISSASIGCTTPEVVELRNQARAAYEDDFVTRYESDIEALILQIREDQEASNSSSTT